MHSRPLWLQPPMNYVARATCHGVSVHCISWYAAWIRAWFLRKGCGTTTSWWAQTQKRQHTPWTNSTSNTERRQTVWSMYEFCNRRTRPRYCHGLLALMMWVNPGPTIVSVLLPNHQQKMENTPKLAGDWVALPEKFAEVSESAPQRLRCLKLIIASSENHAVRELPTNQKTQDMWSAKVTCADSGPSMPDCPLCQFTQS